eukprot:scaffold1400_cov137-Cylindrotheca_fusiformis.AAC.10
MREPAMVPWGRRRETEGVFSPTTASFSVLGEGGLWHVVMLAVQDLERTARELAVSDIVRYNLFSSDDPDTPSF